MAKPVYAADLSSEATKKIEANMSLINSIIKSSKRFDYKYTVYELFDDDGVKYVGRTRQSIRSLPQYEDVETLTSFRYAGKIPEGIS